MGRGLCQELENKAARHESGGCVGGGKSIAKDGKGREREVQALSRVNTSEFEGIELSEEYLCMRNNREEILGYRILLPSAVFKTFRWSAAALPRICHHSHCKDRSHVKYRMVWSDYSLKRSQRLIKYYREDNYSG